MEESVFEKGTSLPVSNDSIAHATLTSGGVREWKRFIPVYDIQANTKASIGPPLFRPVLSINQPAKISLDRPSANLLVLVLGNPTPAH